MYIFWALLSAITVALRRTKEKQLTAHFHPLTISLLTQLFSVPLVALALLLQGGEHLPALGLNFWIPLLVGTCVYPINSYLYLRSVQHGSLSNVLPIQSLMPVFSIVPSFIFFHDKPTAMGFVGMLFIVCGVYVIGLKGRRLHHPFQPFKEDRASLFMLLSVILVSFGSSLDKMASTASYPAFYSLISTLCAITLLYVTRRLKGVEDLKLFKLHAKNFAINGTLQGATYTSYLLALALGPIAYATAIRSSNLLMGSLLGVILFHEKLTKQKILSLVLIIIGACVML